jgi:biopolymer transport protein ExbB
MWPLLFCSLLSLTISLERILFWWREKRRRDSLLLEKIFRMTEAGDVDGLLSLVRGMAAGLGSLDFTARILLSGFAHRRRGYRESMEIAAEDEIARMKQGLNVLDTIITMAPLLGILGTVLGIINSFDLLGNSGIEDPKAVTGGIAQALITTAAGLTVALMTLVPFNYLVARVNIAAVHINKTAMRYEAALRGGLEKGDDGQQRI